MSESTSPTQDAAAPTASATPLIAVGVDSEDSDVLECRFYENEFPEVDECVMVRVNNITDIGAFVSLLEYNMKEGIILLSELSRRRMRTVHKHIRVGGNEVLQVLRVDKEKGYIDLSKRHLKPEDVAACHERYTKSKTVHSILRHVAKTQHVSLEELYKKLAWALYAKYGHAFEAFKEAVTNDNIFEGFDLPANIKDSLLKNIRHRLGVQAVKLQANIEVTCFTSEGINAIKPALKAGLACGTNEEPIRIQLLTSPVYILFTQSNDKQVGFDRLQKAIEAISTEIKKHGGNCIVRVEPRAVSD